MKRTKNRTALFSLAKSIVCDDCWCVDAVGASSGLDGGIRTWDLTTGEGVRSIDGGPVDVWTLTFSPDSQVHISYPDSSEVQWNLSLRTPLK